MISDKMLKLHARYKSVQGDYMHHDIRMLAMYHPPESEGDWYRRMKYTAMCGDSRAWGNAPINPFQPKKNRPKNNSATVHSWGSVA
jgi:hypothetical protein